MEKERYVLPWQNLSESGMMEFILANLDKNSLLDLVDNIYRGNIVSNVIITEDIEKLEDEYISDIRKLPSDVHYLIGLQTDYKDLINLCKSDKTLNKLCLKRDFWINYISQNANLDMNLGFSKKIAFFESLIYYDYRELFNIAKYLFSSDFQKENRYELLYDKTIINKEMSRDILNQVYINEQGYEEEWSYLPEFYRSIDYGGDMIGLYLIDKYGCEGFEDLVDKTKDSIFTSFVENGYYETMKYFIEKCNYLPYYEKYQNNSDYHMMSIIFNGNEGGNIDFFYKYLIKERKLTYFINQEFIDKLSRYLSSYKYALKLAKKFNFEIDKYYFNYIVFESLNNGNLNNAINLIEEYNLKLRKLLYHFIRHVDTKNIEIYKDFIDYLYENINRRISNSRLLKQFESYVILVNKSKFILLQYLIEHHNLQITDSFVEKIDSSSKLYVGTNIRYIVDYLEKYLPEDSSSG